MQLQLLVLADLSTIAQIRGTSGTVLQALDLTMDVEAALTPRGIENAAVHKLKSRQELINHIYRLQVRRQRAWFNCSEFLLPVDDFPITSGNHKRTSRNYSVTTNFN